jgi:hypothetical protein
LTRFEKYGNIRMWGELKTIGDGKMENVFGGMEETSIRARGIVIAKTELVLENSEKNQNKYYRLISLHRLVGNFRSEIEIWAIWGSKRESDAHRKSGCKLIKCFPGECFTNARSAFSIRVNSKIVKGYNVRSAAELPSWQYNGEQNRVLVWEANN